VKRLGWGWGAIRFTMYARRRVFQLPRAHLVDRWAPMAWDAARGVPQWRLRMADSFRDVAILEDDMSPADIVEILGQKSSLRELITVQELPVAKTPRNNSPANGK
jgi:hypothetical protein